jgi:integration host factor subunit beta
VQRSLITALQSKFPGLTLKDVEYAVNSILETMTATLAQNDRIEIRQFGSFRLNYRPPRQGRNPKTGERVQVLGKYAPYFKAGRAMKKLADDC